MLAQGSPSVGLDSALINPRLLLGVETAVVATLLLLLYIYRRRSYILWWMWGWLALSAGSMLSAESLNSVKLDAMVFGLAQFLRIVAGLLFVVATDAYRQAPRLQRSYGILLLPVAIWFTLSPAALGPVAVYSPGFLLVAGSMASAGVAHLLLGRQARLLGATLVGTMLLCFAAVNAYLATTSDLNAAGVLLPIVVIFLLAALGMQLMTFEDMTFELLRANRRLEAAQNDLHQAVITDPLTGTRNRRFFDEVIGREMQRHRRYKTPLSIVFIDVDHFKRINDTLGHETGDQVLREVASFLLRHIREADYVFRWGGDEFLVLISCGEHEALRRGRELQAAFAQSPHLAELPPGVALSVGCVEVPADATDIMPFVQTADERMYEDKKTRRR